MGDDGFSLRASGSVSEGRSLKLIEGDGSSPSTCIAVSIATVRMVQVDQGLRFSGVDGSTFSAFRIAKTIDGLYVDFAAWVDSLVYGGSPMTTRQAMIASVHQRRVE